jgi:hypothetical protein
MYWITSKAGRPIPCDPELVVAHLYLRGPRHTGEEAVTLVTEEGITIRGVTARATEPNTTRVEGYVSHFSTCEHADTFRQKKGVPHHG